MKRTIVMVLVTLAALVGWAGGYTSRLDFGIATYIAVFAGAVPVTLGVLVLQAIERSIGKAGKFVIASIGLLPMLFILGVWVTGYMRISGDRVYTFVFVFAGLVWSIAWVWSAALLKATKIEDRKN